MSLFRSLMASANLFSSSVFPMFLAAWTICLSSSSNLRILRMMLPVKTIIVKDLIFHKIRCLPSKISVILHSCKNVAPLHHSYTMSIM